MPFLLFVLLYLPLASTQAAYYIRPISMLESPCLNGDCLTLSEYATDASKYLHSENLSLVFLQGEHTLNTSITFQQLDTVILQGNVPSLPNITSKIVCDKTATFNLINISNVEISALAFVSCGGQHTVGSRAVPHNAAILEMTGYVAPGIFGLSISNLHLVSCNMKHNHLSLFVSRCTVYLQNSKFMHNKGVFGGAIAAHDSTIVFVGYNHFCNNSASETGGGVFAQSSVLILRGSGAYIGNSAAKHGGGIRVINSSIHFTRDQGDGARVPAGFDNKSYIFAQNSASLSGGGISLNNSIINLKGGNLKFSKNLAYVGGGISSDFSHVFLDDLVVFESNSAVVGGAVAVKIGTWNSTAIRFINNLAEYSGGAVNSLGSRLDFGSVVQMPTSMYQHEQNGTGCYYHSIFNNNTANSGGAIQVYDSTIQFIGNHYFKHNRADRGGGINADLSYVYFNHNSGNMTQELDSISCDRGHGIGLFEQNMAYTDGGSLLLLQTTLKQSRGVLNFTENYANDDGGGLHSQYSFVLFHGLVIFESNSASGGGAVFIHFSIWNSSTTVFESNTAGHQGGAIHSDKSKLTFGLNVNEYNLLVLPPKKSTLLQLNVEVQNSFINNSASYGGALRVNNNCTIEFKGMSLFDSNSAKRLGGSISTTRSNIHFSGQQTNFTGNSAQKFGGGIDAATSALIFSEETTFTGNKAHKNGGGIYLRKSFLNVSRNGKYIDNVAGVCGGAISAIDHDVLLFDGKSTFVMNSATFGGAVSVVEGKMSFTGTSNFTRNWATNSQADWCNI